MMLDGSPTTVATPHPLVDRGLTLVSMAVAIVLGARSMNDITVLDHQATVFARAPVRDATSMATGSPDRPCRDRRWKPSRPSRPGTAGAGPRGKSSSGRRCHIRPFQT